MTTTRRTSIYRIYVPGSDPDTLVAGTAGHPLHGSGTQDGIPYVHVRLTDDTAAADLAGRISGGQPFTIRTGLGIHSREVTA